jgi:hypothetical protein
MRKKIIVVLILFAFLNVTAIGLLFTTTTASTTEFIDYEPLDVGSRLRKSELPIKFDSFEESAETSSLKTSDASLGEIKNWLSLDDYYGYYFFAPFLLMAQGNTAEVWVQLDLSWPEGDPRQTSIITQEQVDYLLMEFETNIYPTDTEYFGTPDSHNGRNSLLEDWGYVPKRYYFDKSGREVILVSNFRDDNYYDPEYPYYIAGFYSPSFEAYFDRNIISIDSHQWEERVGPDGSRPYLYEGVIAHEYQHLIHDDYNPEDDTFMNEGCSMFAEPLCGYPISWGDINSYLATPDNSLTEWGDQGGINILADYGASLLWALYLNDQYGSDFLGYFTQAGIPGIAGINSALSYFGYTESFENAYHDWRIANLIHTDFPGNGKYNYVSIDLGGPEADPARVYEISNKWPNDVTGTSFGNTISILGYDTGISLLSAYGSDYISFTNLVERQEPVLEFDGYDTAFAPTWIREDMDNDGDLEWYSTPAGSEADLQIFAEVDLSGLATTLSFDTYYDIEVLWDYGFVQVSTDGGATWFSLANEYTTYDHDPNAYPAIIENLPGLTGLSDGWINMGFDVSAFAGQSILIGFRYMTDWAFEEPGWWVDNIAIDGAIIDNADDIITFTFPPNPETDFLVTLIAVEENGNGLKYKNVVTVDVDDVTETATELLDRYIEKDGYVLLIVSSNLGPAEYTINIYRT